MDPFGTKAIMLATAMSSFLSLRAYKRKSLTTGGSVAAFAVAFLLVGTGLRGLNLLTFYFVSIKATKYKVRACVLVCLESYKTDMMWCGVLCQNRC